MMVHMQKSHLFVFLAQNKENLKEARQRKILSRFDRFGVYRYQRKIHTQKCCVECPDPAVIALVKRMVLADAYVSGHCISACTHTPPHKKRICFSGTQDWQKGPFVAAESKKRIGQPTGNRPRRSPQADSLFRQRVVNFNSKEH